MNILIEPWHWAFSGVMISTVMFMMLLLGKKFGVSSSFRAMCAIGGGGKLAKYFNYNWKDHSWLLLFVVGSIIGGYLSSSLLNSTQEISLSDSTLADMAEYGLIVSKDSGHASSLYPESLFALESLGTLRGFVVFVLGGFLIGFGTRWAGGCTSGHAISGLSNLQLPSLVAVCGFFIGGLLMTHLLLPIILKL